MSGILFDTNVLLDIATGDAIWLGWSEGQFRAAGARLSALALIRGASMICFGVSKLLSTLP